MLDERKSLIRIGSRETINFLRSKELPLFDSGVLETLLLLLSLVVSEDLKEELSIKLSDSLMKALLDEREVVEKTRQSFVSRC